MSRHIFAAAAVICAAAAPVEAQTLQQRYDAAEAALAAGEYEKASTLFADVLARMGKTQRGTPAEADLRQRIGETDIALGRLESGLATLTPVIAIYEKAKATSALVDAHGLIGRAHEKLGEMRQAAESYQAAYDLNTDPAKIQTLSIPLARALVFTDAARARRMADAMLKDFRPGEDKRRSGELLGEFQMLRGRVELNAGNHKEALEWFKTAAKSAGGIGTRVSLSDIAIRSDLALASFLTGDLDKAFYYIAMTGAGRMGGKGPQFPDGSALTLPDCSPAFNLGPDDLVVLDIALSDDGRVLSAAPVYSSKPGEIEAVFVKAARSWLWSAEEMQKTEPFWRISTRVAVRCTFNTERRWIGDAFMRELVGETKAQTVSFGPLAGKADTETLRRELARLEAATGPDSPALVPVLTRLAEKDDEGVYVERARQIMEASDLSARRRAILDALIARNRVQRGGEALQRQPDASWPSDVADWFRVEQALELEKRRRSDRAEPLYAEVFRRGDPKTDTLAQFAALRLASIAYDRKAQEQASGFLAATGLRPDQCALLDAAPIGRNNWVTADDYPQAAVNWGAEGYIVMGYDIAVDGKVKTPRVVFAYPPFVFEDTMEAVVGRWRFKPIYREGEQIGCTGARQTFRFFIPGKS